MNECQKKKKRKKATLGQVVYAQFSRDKAGRWRVQGQPELRARDPVSKQKSPAIRRGT